MKIVTIDRIEKQKIRLIATTVNFTKLTLGYKISINEERQKKRKTEKTNLNQ